MSRAERHLGGWLAAVFVAVGAFAYLHNTGSQYAATNPDEYLYLQIARLTAESGAWLPLQSAEMQHRNTKPPMLFWQGIAATGFGDHWELWRLRLPNALFSVATAAMAMLLARRIAGTWPAGAVAALAYLSFLGVYRHGRVFLTTAPETFWLFLPFFVLLMLPRPALGWGTAAAFGLIFGAGLLCKSFAMVIPSAAALAWWAWRARGYRLGEFLGKDAPKIALTTALALGVFGLWFLLDPQRQFILQDFVLKENVGKFDAKESGYLATALWGKHSIWQYSLGWLTNAGLVAPVVAAVFVLGWRNRRRMTESESLLWIWVITLFVFHLLPNLRYERYLLPAMPAVAVLCGLYWEKVPRWALGVTVAAAVVALLALLAGSWLLAGQLPEIPIYGFSDWLALAGMVALGLAALARREWLRVLALPSVLFVYLGFAIFLQPFDGPPGAFACPAVEAARGRSIVYPSHFTARDELIRFLLPGANLQRIKAKELPEALADATTGTIIVPVGLDDPQELDGFDVVGRRLVLNDYFNADQTSQMLRGRVAEHLFGWELLAARRASTANEPTRKQE